MYTEEGVDRGGDGKRARGEANAEIDIGINKRIRSGSMAIIHAHVRLHSFRLSERRTSRAESR